MVERRLSFNPIVEIFSSLQDAHFWATKWQTSTPVFKSHTGNCVKLEHSTANRQIPAMKLSLTLD